MPRECASEPPLLHYLSGGFSNRLDPHPLFDTAFFVAQVEPGALCAEPPLLRFLRAGARSELRPNPLFDAAYYRRVNTFAGASRHPLLHYIEIGWREGCRPHPLFDPAYYLAQRPDVAAAGLDPLAHYLRHGRHETASTHALFDAAHYRSALAAHGTLLDEKQGILHYATSLALSPPSPHPLFDRDLYADRHCATADPGEERDPFLHFLEPGRGAGPTARPGHDLAHRPRGRDGAPDGLAMSLACAGEGR